MATWHQKRGGMLSSAYAPKYRTHKVVSGGHKQFTTVMVLESKIKAIKYAIATRGLYIPPLKLYPLQSIKPHSGYVEYYGQWQYNSKSLHARINRRIGLK